MKFLNTEEFAAFTEERREMLTQYVTVDRDEVPTTMLPVYDALEGHSKVVVMYSEIESLRFESDKFAYATLELICTDHKYITGINDKLVKACYSKLVDLDYEHPEQYLPYYSYDHIVTTTAEECNKLDPEEFLIPTYFIMGRFIDRQSLEVWVTTLIEVLKET